MRAALEAPPRHGDAIRCLQNIVVTLAQQALYQKVAIVFDVIDYQQLGIGSCVVDRIWRHVIYLVGNAAAPC